jgi:hypothetical protein
LFALHQYDGVFRPEQAQVVCAFSPSMRLAATERPCAPLCFLGQGLQGGPQAKPVGVAAGVFGGLGFGRRKTGLRRLDLFEITGTQSYVKEQLRK